MPVTSGEDSKSVRIDRQSGLCYTLRMKIHSHHPLNAEPDLPILGRDGITSAAHVFHRNHCSIPRLPADHLVTVEGLVSKKYHFSLADLKNSFESFTALAVLQCAGNRRAQMSERCSRETEGLQWSAGAVANVRWTGVRLRHVLASCGLSPAVRHIIFECHAVACEDAKFYGASIDVEKAMQVGLGEPMIAYEMNGEALSSEHGYPLRVVVPGYAGARSVKWLDKIIASDVESQNFYQQRDYKILPPNVISQEDADWSAVPALQTLPLQSAITEVVRVGKKYRVSGYAIAREGNLITRVEVSSDQTVWHDAALIFKEGPFSWVLWESEVSSDESIFSRATDVTGKQRDVTTWNLRGVGYAGYGYYETQRPQR